MSRWSVSFATRPQEPASRRAALAYGIIGFFGFVDAAYLSFEHVRGVAPSCSFLQGCDVVTLSPYAVLMGIPVAFLGVAYYATIIVAAVAHLDTHRPILLTVIAVLSVAGVAMSGWFVYIQLDVIGAVCVYCMLSATLSVLLFANTVLWQWSLQRINR